LGFGVCGCGGYGGGGVWECGCGCGCGCGCLESGCWDGREGWDGRMGVAVVLGWQSVVAVEDVEVEVLHTAIQHSIQYASRHNPVCGTSKGRQGSFCVSAGTLTARIVKIDGDQREPRTGAYILVCRPHYYGRYGCTMVCRKHAQPRLAR
jgi:hypothetical protein